jgi:hypothetical protein
VRVVFVIIAYNCLCFVSFDCFVNVEFVCKSVSVRVCECGVYFDLLSSYRSFRGDVHGRKLHFRVHGCVLSISLFSWHVCFDGTNVHDDYVRHGRFGGTCVCVLYV